MTTLTVTAQGRVTLHRDVLKHLGVRQGEKIELDKLPGGGIVLKASRPSSKIADFIGLLAGKTTKVATLAEIKDMIEVGWARQN